MIGGLFKSASVASIAAAGLLMGGVSAQAADLGGNCCADLEERVAELEATTARKGNRKVSLEVSGQVHEAIVFFDAPGESNVYIGTHNSSRSRFRFKGSAKIDADWSAGFLMEFGVRANHLGSVHQDEPHDGRGLDIRHEALYLKSNTLGTVWLGWTSSATDGITEICLGCGLGNGPDWNDDMQALRTFNGGLSSFGDHGSFRDVFAGEGDRREVIRYISPTLAGFVLSAAYGHDDFYDVALRYAGEFGSIRLAAGVGYQRSNDAFDTAGLHCGNEGTLANTIDADSGAAPSVVALPFDNPNSDCSSLGASGGIQHVPTGLYVAGAYGLDTDEITGEEDTAWHVTGGVNQKFFAVGKTNIWGMYTESERSIGIGAPNTTLTVYGVGIEQNIDAAAMELYVWYKRLEAEDPTVGIADVEADVVTAGARIKF